MTTENVVEFEENRRKSLSFKGVGLVHSALTEHYGNLYSDAYQSLSIIFKLKRLNGVRCIRNDQFHIKVWYLIKRFPLQRVHLQIIHAQIVICLNQEIHRHCQIGAFPEIRKKCKILLIWAKTVCKGYP